MHKAGVFIGITQIIIPDYMLVEGFNINPVFLKAKPEQKELVKGDK